MSGVKHTPGPWFEQTGFSDDVEITAESREGMVAICSMDLGFTGRIGVEQESNARLISAAPDLLEAAEWADKALERYVDALGLDQTDEAALISLYKIKDAIARARGEQDGGGHV